MSLIFGLSTYSNKVFGHLPKPLQHRIIAIVDRARDPKPEMSVTGHEETEQQGTIVWGWLPILALTNALGVLSVAYAYLASRYVSTNPAIFFWLGLLFIFSPSTGRLISPKASRFERIGILCVVGICLYIVAVMYSPLYFSSFDEFLHLITADTIAGSGHLFGQNALLPVSPDFPGLEIVTNALSTLSGLSTYHAGIVVVGVARLVMILSFFLLNEQIMKSARMAGIATIIYMANQHFLVFDAQFAYESLALPLATFALFAVAYETLNDYGSWVVIAGWITLGAVVATHHTTDFILDGFLVLWALTFVSLRTAPIRKSGLVQTALFGVVLSIGYVVFIAQPVVGYVVSFLGNALNELWHVLVGSSGARQLFVDYSGEPTPLWERAVSLSSIALIVLSLPFGLLCLWQRYRSNALAWVSGIVSLCYPLTLLLRFTNSGGEVADRTAAFLFIPLSCVLAIFVVQFWPTRLLRWKQTTLITCAITVVLLSGVIVGSGPPWNLLPGGPYLVAADAHSIEPDGMQAAIWARSYLGPNNRVATDRINQLLMAAYGEQRDITSIEDRIEVAQILLSSSLGPHEIAILRSAKIRYIVVDMRLANGLPRLGFYVDPAEPGAFHYVVPIDQEALTKFTTIPQIYRVFDSGNIIIYDVGGLVNAP
jgi:hypothetical protein